MTHAQFVIGWTLLILQPWGWRYRGLNVMGHPSEESTLQLQFYFSKLKWAHGSAWLKVASDHAQGHQWPSVNELNQALRFVNVKFVAAVTDQRTASAVPMPEDVRERILRFAGKSF